MALTLPEEQDLDTARDLALWLEESGRRKLGTAWVASLQTERLEPTQQAAKARPNYITQPALLSLLAMAGFAGLLYYFTYVQLRILEIPGIVVFIGS
jgi:hypothetical protein